MPYSGSVRAETQILSYTWGGGICRGCLGANAQWFTWQTHLTDWFSFDWCKTKRSEIAYFCYEAHQRKTYCGCLRAQRQILCYTRCGGMCGSPMNANVWCLTCQTDHTNRFWVIQCSWNFFFFSWTSTKNALRWQCEGPETNSFIYLGLGHVYGSLGCQCSVAYMTDSPYRLVFIRLMQDEKEWNSLLLLWSTPKKDLRWLFEGPETNSFIYQGWWHVWESLECQCSMANMSDRPYRQVLSHPMQLKLLIVFMDDSK